MNVNKAMKNFQDKYPGINQIEITTDYTYDLWIPKPSRTLSIGLDGDGYLFGCRALTIKKVIFNDPATIVFWSDGTKTVVKKQKPDGKKKFDKEKGLALAIAKKMAGNTGVYYNEFKKWCE